MAPRFDESNPKLQVEFDVPRNLSISIITLRNLSIGQSRKEFETFENEIFEEIRLKSNLEDLKDDTILGSYRELYWSFGMDPTKLRVSSEALLRRILRGENLWRISDLVDVVNLASPYHKLPIGLIDEAKREGKLTIRTAQRGEVFTRIGGKEMTCRGREIVLADEEKILCFGYATHDSNLSKVDTGSKDVLVLLYGSPVVTREMLASSTQITLEMIQRWIDCVADDLSFFYSNTV
ncbi:MAG: hypothetical protein EAX95_04165 [Candidatus Thorarchaeota archaeon]|nr:hypothetical protein [Candidatus Thorarchaeota archaeon]